VNIYDVREDGSSPEETDYATCEMCGKEQIRFVHTMEHDDYHSLDVGCICAGNMENDYEGAKRREAKARNRAARKAKWLSRKWKRSKGNQYINAERHNLVVFPHKFRPGWWKFKIDDKFSSATYKTVEEAKLAMFDAFEEVLESEHVDDEYDE
jgi:hypothetical protein